MADERTCRTKPLKKSPLAVNDSTADDDSTMMSPKTTRNSVVPSSKK